MRLYFLEMRQCLRNICDDRHPVARRGLAEEAPGGVPGTVFTLQHPAPVRHIGKQRPYSTAHSTSEMTEGRIDRDRQIGRANNRGNIRKIVQLIAKMDDIAARAELC